MNEKLLHTPEGVRDIYDTECKKRNQIIKRLHHVLDLYSYHDIQTPSFEFFDIFNVDEWFGSSNELYKFFDRENNILVLRPDITPSIARCVAKYYDGEELPIRLCYQGNTFFNANNLQGKLREITQLGAELIHDDSSAADAEVIATVIDCFLASGLTEFHVDIGQVDFLKGIIEEAELSVETEMKIHELIHNKNFFALGELIKTLDLTENIKQVLLSFDSLFGGLEMLDRAKGLVTNTRSIQAIERLEKVYAALSYYQYEQYAGFDFSQLSGYGYYTGIVFRGYTYEASDAVVKGGRYNNLLKQFGKEAPAIGFAFYIDDLMMALNRQKIEVAIDNADQIVLYNAENQKAAITLANRYRKEYKKIELIRKSARKTLEDYISYGKKKHFNSMLYLESDSSAIEINFVTGETKNVTL